MKRVPIDANLLTEGVENVLMTIIVNDALCQSNDVIYVIKVVSLWSVPVK